MDNNSWFADIYQDNKKYDKDSWWKEDEPKVDKDSWWKNNEASVEKD